MKKLLLLFILSIAININAQNELILQIDTATQFSSMPVIKVPVSRDVYNSTFALIDNKIVDKKQIIPSGEIITLHYPVYIFDSGNVARAVEMYNYISTEAEITPTTLLLGKTVLLSLNSENRKLVLHWLGKYQKLMIKEMKKN